MCNPCSETKGQAAIRGLFRTVHDRTGNLPAFPGIFPIRWLRSCATARMVSANWLWRDGSARAPRCLAPSRSRRSATSRARTRAAGFRRRTAVSCPRHRSASTNHGSKRHRRAHPSQSDARDPDYNEEFDLWLEGEPGGARQMTGRRRRSVSVFGGRCPLKPWGKWSLNGRADPIRLRPPSLGPLFPGRKRADPSLTFLSPTIVLEICAMILDKRPRALIFAFFCLAAALGGGARAAQVYPGCAVPPTTFNHIWYIDPVNGKTPAAGGNGSQIAPWNSLQGVVSATKQSGYSYPMLSTVPYDHYPQKNAQGARFGATGPHCDPPT